MNRAEELASELREQQERALDRMIRERHAEGPWLDFKNRGDPPDNEKNLGKAMSAFANTDGGVVIWGIDARSVRGDPADVARAKRPFDDPAGFVSELQRLTSRVVHPPVIGVDHFPIAAAGGTQGFVVSYVPASPALPHRRVQDGHYFIRTGSSSEVAPHALLAAMFGRRPAPYVRALAAVVAGTRNAPNQFVMRVMLGIRNAGSVPARNLYFAARRRAPHRGFNVEFVEQPGAHPLFEATILADRAASTYEYSATSRPERMLAPGVSAAAAIIEVGVVRDREDAVWIEGLAGCEGALPTTFSLTLRASARHRLLAAFGNRNHLVGSEAASWAAEAIDPDAFGGGDILHHLDHHL